MNDSGHSQWHEKSFERNSIQCEAALLDVTELNVTGFGIVNRPIELHPPITCTVTCTCTVFENVRTASEKAVHFWVVLNLERVPGNDCSPKTMASLLRFIKGALSDFSALSFSLGSHHITGTGLMFRDAGLKAPGAGYPIRVEGKGMRHLTWTIRFRAFRFRKASILF